MFSFSMSAGRSRLSDVHVRLSGSRSEGSWCVLCTLWSSPYALVRESTRRSCLSEVNCCSNPVFSNGWCGMCTAEYAVFWCRPLSLITYFICIVALIRVSVRDAVMLFLYWHRGKATLITSYTLFQWSCTSEVYCRSNFCRLFIFDGYSPVPSDDRMHVALAYSLFIVLRNRLVYYFHRRLVYSAQIRIMSSPLCKLSWQVLVRKKLYSGVKCSRVGLYKEGCVILIVSCAVWLVSVSPALFYL